MKILWSFICLVSMAIGAQALNCWVCEGCRSNDECLARGRLQRCQNNQRACQNQVRRGSYGMLIWKQCKQAHACDNNFVQNPRASWSPSQCNTRTPSSVCRCCCDFDGCNRRSLECEERTPITPRTRGRDLTCSRLLAPRNGGMTCAREGVASPTQGRLVVGTECSFTCNRGYTLDGARVSMCDTDPVRDVARFNRRPPVCRPNRCRGRQRKPQGGSVTCTRGRQQGSVCSFECDEGFDLIGSPTTTCQNNRIWSNPPPTCSRVVCDPPHADPLNGLVTCTNFNNRGSECRFECSFGYALEGNPLSTCVQSLRNPKNGEWTFPAPVCREILCNPQVGPSNGAVVCNGNTLGSVCDFSCSEGFFLVGDIESTCVDDGNDDTVGAWTAPPPTCQDVLCDRLDAPSDGVINCNGLTVGSVCQFSCNEGFYLDGDSQATCFASGSEGEWTTGPPLCEEIRCYPAHNALSGGSVTCSNENLEGSICEFECFGILELVGSESTECISDGNDAEGVWTSPAPTCVQPTPIVCTSHVAPSNGDVDCSAGPNVGSTCLFSCNLGYYLDGSAESSCVSNGGRGRWTTTAPTCPEITCRRRESPPNGRLQCNGESLGSLCLLDCNQGFYIAGGAVSTCEVDGDDDAFGSWSGEPPTCRVTVCQEQSALVNGFVDCGQSVSYNTRCIFVCKPGYNLVGNATVVCDRLLPELGMAGWSSPPPTCEPITCAPLGPIRNGNVSCTNDEFLGSVCTVECDTAKGYVVYPPDSDELTCLRNRSWDRPTPCCSRQCPPYAKMDLVLVLDSSSSIGNASWITMTDFVRNIIESFVVSSQFSRIAVIRYNRRVDTRHEILLEDFPDDRDGLVAAFNEIPYNGFGTRTGNAVRYVSNRVLREANGDRPDARNVVLVITDGRAQDGGLLRNASIRLRESGALTYAVGVGTSVDRGQLLDIAGTADNRFIAESGFSGLDETLSIRLTENICESRCSVEGGTTGEPPVTPSREERPPRK